MSIRSFRAALTALCAVLGTGAHGTLQADEVGRYLLGERLARLETKFSGHRTIRLAGFQDPALGSDAEIFAAPGQPPHPESMVEPTLQEATLSLEELPEGTRHGRGRLLEHDGAHGEYLEPCPVSSSCSPCPPCCDVPECCCCSTKTPWFTCYGECQLVFARPHVVEGGLGVGPNPMKLSERYDLSPRTIVGIERFDGNGVRARYWRYDEQLADIANAGAPVGFEFEVFDLEGYHRFRTSWADVTVSGGFRAAQIGTNFDGDWHDNTALGVTFAADGESLICCYRNHYWSGVYGARLSLLGGDWASSGPGIPALRDDNFTVTELHAGLEHGCRLGASDLYWRLGIELQNWQSDNLAGNTNTDSIGFVGPSFQFGASF